MSKVTYCNRWVRLYSKPAGRVSEKEAASRFAGDEPFCVVVWESERPVGFIEVGGDVFGAGFLDEQGRAYLDYTFEKRGDRLFLTQVIHLEHGEDARVERNTRWVFREDGSMTVVVAAPEGRDAEVREAVVSVAENWEPLPSFEMIPDLLRAERSLPK